MPSDRDPVPAPPADAAPRERCGHYFQADVAMCFKCGIQKGHDGPHGQCNQAVLSDARDVAAERKCAIGGDVDVVPALPAETLKAIRAKLEHVEEASRNGELNVFEQAHHASWADIEYLLTRVEALRAQPPPVPPTITASTTSEPGGTTCTGMLVTYPELYGGVAEREMLHTLIADCHSVINPEEHAELDARIVAVLEHYDWRRMRPDIWAWAVSKVASTCALIKPLVDRRVTHLAIQGSAEHAKLFYQLRMRHGGNLQIPFYLLPGQCEPEYDQGDSVIVWYDDLYDLAHPRAERAAPAPKESK